MVQFPAKLSPLTPHHPHTLMLQTPTKLAKNWGPKNIILLIRSSVRHCTVRQSPLSRYGQISVCEVMLAVRHRSVRPTGRNVPMMGEFQPICYQPSPAQPAQPSPAPLWGMRRNHLQCVSDVFNVVRDQILCRKSHYLWEISRRPSRCFCPN